MAGSAKTDARVRTISLIRRAFVTRAASALVAGLAGARASVASANARGRTRGGGHGSTRGNSGQQQNQTLGWGDSWGQNDFFLILGSSLSNDPESNETLDVPVLARRNGRNR